MPGTAIVERPFDCSSRITVNNAVVANAADGGGGVTEGDGRGPERNIISAEGHWSNCDLYVVLPPEWVTAVVQLRIYARHALGRALLAEGTVDLMGLRPQNPPPVLLPGGFFGLALQVRGHPCDGFEVEARTATTVIDGGFVMEVWGTESDPQGIAQRPGAGIDDVPMAQTAACMLGLATAGALAGQWVPWELSSTGTVVVTGNDTPGDAFANPTDALTTWSLTAVWNGADWERWQASPYADGPVGANLAGVNAFALGWDDDNAIARRLRTSGEGLWVVPHLPNVLQDVTGPAPDLRDATVTRIVSGGPVRIFSFDVCNETAALLYFQIHNKGGALVLGDVPVYSFAVATSVTAISRLSLGTEFFTTMGAFFDQGLVWGWSTTRATYTAAGAFVGLVNVNYLQ